MRQRFPRCCIVLSFCLAGCPAVAADYAWLIGGGPDPDGSQAQIEFNVNWVRGVLRARSKDTQVYVYYTDGNGPSKDVKEAGPVSETREALTPLARVFGQIDANAGRFRDHRLGKVDGGTEAGALKERLASDFQRLRPGDRVLLMYNGHGLGNEDAADNVLRLWRDTRLSVRDLDELLSKIDSNVPVRFVFTQCYSGGFARLIRPQALDVVNLGPATRCGFLAESETRESEGCSAGINIGDYRDYTTYFFAAIDGQTRLGQPVEGDADRDGDGQVSPYEAHLYALREAHNADLPRSTSEVYLERWQPWYLRWIETGAEPDNVYGDIARAVAVKQNLPQAGRMQTHQLSARRAKLRARMREVEEQREALRREIDAAQQEIRRELVLRWPELRTPYTRHYARFLKEDVSAAQDLIVDHPGYGKLVRLQDQIAALDAETLVIERDITQLDKVVRLRTLARLKAQFERHAGDERRKEYERLLACETAPL